MPYPYESILRAKAIEFVTQLNQQLAYDVDIDPESYREYSVALDLGDLRGKSTIYYSPKKKSFKLVNQGLDAAIVDILNLVWETLDDTATTDKKEPLSPPRTAHQAYVDGSYHKQKKTVGYGAVILQGNKKLVELSGRVHQYVESRQIGGELEATIQVIRWCEANNVTEIDVYYDYKGIEMWATGRWKTNKKISQTYRDAMKASKVKVHWHKVKSHTGVKWNDVADELAKKGTLS